MKLPHRLGLRYINFFDFNIFDKLDLDITLRKKSIDYESTYLQTVFKEGVLSSHLRLSSAAALADGTTGSLLDIDILYMSPSTEAVTANLSTTLDSLHDFEGRTFFGLLKPDYVVSLTDKGE